MVIEGFTMKLSIAWIFDHINQDYKKLDIPNLVDKFSRTTAEVDQLIPVRLDLDNFSLVIIKEISEEKIVANSPELKKDIILPVRKDVSIGQIYLIIKEKKAYRWARCDDLGSEKNENLTNLWCEEQDLKGNWKKNFEIDDYILEVDNTALTHRPDMWGHRGFAREFAALLNTDLVSEEIFLDSKPIKHYTNRSVVAPNNPFIVEISEETSDCGNPCKRFAGLYIQFIENKPSTLFMATRLARIDSRPIGFIVDATNYVMFDFGQPIHAFDADKIKTKKIVTRCAQDGEKITLLDGTNVNLNSSDYVITDSRKAIALAGIMGGLETEVSSGTTSLFIESANFDSSSIRRTSLKVKKRTDASIRFEKGLDPNQNTHAILRFLKLISNSGIQYKAADSIVSIGNLIQEKTIDVAYNLIINRIGTYISENKIKEILLRLGFGVQVFNQENEISFTITVPTYRATKEILAEDIIEEVARSFGYSNISMNLPIRQMVPFDISPIVRLRSIKKHFAYSLSMYEVQTYGFFDEGFLKEINYNTKDALLIENPQSENYRRLVTSLVPNLLKCISTNKYKEDSLRFFEYNRVWFIEKDQPVEFLQLAGIIYEHKRLVDFYDCKALLSSLWDLLKINTDWTKPKANIEIWYDTNKTADILYQGRIIGRAGKIALEMMSKIGPGDAFIFELDGSFLLSFKAKIDKFVPLHKYPEVKLDISLLVDQNITSEQIIQTIKKVDSRIEDVRLIDYFLKKEWGEKKSLTFSYIIYDKHKTLVKEEIDNVELRIKKEVAKLGATIR